VELLVSGEKDAAVGVKDEKIVHFPLKEALSMNKPINMEIYRLVDEMSI